MEDVRSDFVEMFLHHAVTLVLYGLSYMLYMLPGGSIIMYLHDWADIFLALARCFSETTLSSITLLGGVGLIVSWLYTRLIVFAYVIYSIFFA